MKTLHNKQWFLDRIGKRIYRDKSTCTCPTCANVEENGLVIADEKDADYLFNVQNDFANDGDYLNYRDENTI